LDAYDSAGSQFVITHTYTYTDANITSALPNFRGTANNFLARPQHWHHRVQCRWHCKHFRGTAKHWRCHWLRQASMALPNVSWHCHNIGTAVVNAHGTAKLSRHCQNIRGTPTTLVLPLALHLALPDFPWNRNNTGTASCTAKLPWQC
jgi:hypothetical protein